MHLSEVRANNGSPLQEGMGSQIFGNWGRQKSQILTVNLELTNASLELLSHLPQFLERRRHLIDFG